MRTSMIVAADEGDSIGLAGTLPWHFPADLRRFKQLTLGHAVVAGRRTHDEIVARLGRPLPGRFSVVVTSRPGLPSGSSGGSGKSDESGAENAVFQPDAVAALNLARGIESFAGRDEVFVIGGAQIYTQLLGEVDRVYLTRVHRRTEGDTVLPAGWLEPFSLIGEEDSGQDQQLSFLTYERAQS
ncbi:dihydrofolate reductase [Streptacidiphilus sp. N1-12]|uniref:dihydrofolate reductase n=2 Tax=Streptacidiphilus alkalitolerans TaxID=3342712 RepID=A0ABV6V663_9ACTN